MNNKLKIALVAGLALANVACISPSSVEGGVEGVKTHKPWVFGHGGVDMEPISTGLEWLFWSTSVDRYNIKPKKYTERFVDLTANDNVAIDFNAYITLAIRKGESPIIHDKSGKDWYSNKVQDYFRTVVRNEGRTRSSIELRTKPDIINDSQENIKQKMITYMNGINLPVDVVKIVIGKVVPPQEVLDEAERTAAQKQREETQAARTKAENARAAAEKATALADKAFSNEFNMTTDQFLRNKRLDLLEMAIMKKDGDVNLILNASDATPIFNATK